jgi:hypothetical protein
MIIGLNGGMGVGKSTAFEILKKHFIHVKLIKFAQPLYDMQEFVYDRIKSVHTRPEDFVKDRKLLQWLGTDWGRDTISKTLWVDLWKAAAKQAHHEGYAVIVCDDVRFDNEAEAIRQAGGVVLSITSEAAKARITTANGIAGHKSEAGISPDLIHFSIANDGTLEQYENSLLAALNKPVTR